MNIRIAERKDIELVRTITYRTIEEIYPRYYPEGAVAFFLAHHSKENIEADIGAGDVFLMEAEGIVTGTVTVKVSEINRLFILPQYQGKGYGRELLRFSEQMIAEKSEKIEVSASFPAKEMYLKHGYKEISSHSILTENGDFLCYDLMEKRINTKTGKINYDGKVFVPKINSENGEVGEETAFYYQQSGTTLWADYAGGKIVRGQLVGSVSGDGALDFYYQHINKDRQVRTGKCHSIPHILEDGKLELHEEWQWLNGDKSKGISIIIEK